MQGTALEMSCSCYSIFLSSSSCNLEAMGRSSRDMLVQGVAVECIKASRQSVQKWEQ